MIRFIFIRIISEKNYIIHRSQGTNSWNWKEKMKKEKNQQNMSERSSIRLSLSQNLFNLCTYWLKNDKKKFYWVCYHCNYQMKKKIMQSVYIMNCSILMIRKVIFTVIWREVDLIYQQIETSLFKFILWVTLDFC